MALVNSKNNFQALRGNCSADSYPAHTNYISYGAKKQAVLSQGAELPLVFCIDSTENGIGVNSCNMIQENENTPFTHYCINGALLFVYSEELLSVVFNEVY